LDPPFRGANDRQCGRLFCNPIRARCRITCRQSAAPHRPACDCDPPPPPWRTSGAGGGKWPACKIRPSSITAGCGPCSSNPAEGFRRCHRGSFVAAVSRQAGSKKHSWIRLSAGTRDDGDGERRSLSSGGVTLGVHQSTRGETADAGAAHSPPTVLWR